MTAYKKWLRMESKRPIRALVGGIRKQIMVRRRLLIIDCYESVKKYFLE